MPATLKDVAERAGVSRSAVSRAFTEGASVAPATRQRIEKAAEALGYRPNALASSLTTGRTKMIGLVSNNFHNPIFLSVFDLFTRALQDRGLRPLLVNLTDETDPENSVRMLRQYSVDGVIVASSTLPVSFAEAFHAAGMPVVHSFGRHVTFPKVDVIGIDNIAAGRMAAETLARRGYKNVGFLGGPADATSTQDRYTGFAEGLSRHVDMSLTTSYAAAYAFEAGRDEMLRLCAAAPLADAYFCGDDVLSIGALSALKDKGLKVPEDVGLIGLNNMAMAGWQNINLTTISNPVPQIIEKSVELVASSVTDRDHRPAAHTFRCTVIERGTLRPEA
ncbi:MAG: LacI family DNA-binding transcriptional regulator [Pseudomonadota bacterium]